MSSTYAIPAASIDVETEVKKSRFIARAARCQQREQALALLEQTRRDYPAANHYCWAYQFGHPDAPRSAAMSDDGEPSGTAGRPILNVLSHQPIGDLMVIVVRYFGGIRLGAGGLVRAYGQAAKAVLEQLPLAQQQHLLQYQAECQFAQEAAVRQWLQQNHGELLAVDYQHNVTLQLQIPDTSSAAWVAFCAAERISLTASGSEDDHA
ncbi:MAG TPA: YigZ family protein [Motiliproteus sp.]